MDLYLNKQRFLEDARIAVPQLDESLVSRAWDFARDIHLPQARVTGEGYFSHPVGVAHALLDIRCDSETLAAALLHDVVEDTPVKLKDIEKEFGPTVASLVDGVTKLAPFDTPPDQAWAGERSRRENLRKLFVSIVDDPRVALVKLADRLNNLSTLGALSEDRRQKIARESLEIFAPLAEALELGVFQSRIQELAFRHLEPEVHAELTRKIEERQPEFDMTLQTVIDLLDHALQKDKISADVYGRRKEPYSIYRKMVSLDLDFEAIYDIVGVRILVDTVEECYLADLAVDKLGDKVKYDDYIERPRGPLGYQSLHRVLQDVTGGTLIEVQIRTREMHERAERGSAAHWIYKLGGMTPDDAMIKKISELRERLEALRNTLSDLGDAPEGISLDEFVDTIRDNALGPRIHVLTPQGHLISLPKGATPIDFAYHIHTDLGHECFGAKVDDKSVRLDHELEDGNKVEIIRRKGSSPKLYWLSEGKVKSSRAKQKIRQYFKQQGRPKAISFGRNIVQKRLAAVRTYSVQVEDVVKIFSQSHTLGISSDEDLYLAVAEDRISADRLTRTIGEWLVERALTGVSLPRQAVSELATVCSEAKLITLPRHERLFVAVGDGSITADTLDRAVRSLADRGSEPSQISAGVPAISSRTATSGLLNRPAQCCYPLPGDPIVGYVTLGRGLAIHRAICPNALVSERQGRIIPIEWRDLELDEGQTFSGELFLVMSKADSKTYQAIQDKVQRLKGVMRVLTSPMGTSNRVVSQVRLIVDVKSISHLRNIERSLQQIPDVINVRRSHEE